MEKITAFVIKYRKKIIILAAITLLNYIFGFDWRFTIMNLIWLFI